jgi:type IV secretory pathway protease TraF
VPRGYVWLMSDYNPRSFDSRYFGPIPVKQIQGPAKLVLKW